MQKVLTHVAVAVFVFAGAFLGMKAVTPDETGEVAPFIAVCNSDDGSGDRPCIWIAEYMGDGKGTSFFKDLDGNIHPFDSTK